MPPEESKVFYDSSQQAIPQRIVQKKHVLGIADKLVQQHVVSSYRQAEILLLFVTLVSFLVAVIVLFHGSKNSKDGVLGSPIVSSPSATH